MKMNRGSGGVWVAPTALGQSPSTPVVPPNTLPRTPSNSGIYPSAITSPNSGVPAGCSSIGGPVRRACPASGAEWNVQVVRGKVTGRCLWNACKALSLGLLLMVLGAAMATIGYYADHLSVAQVVRGNHTVRVKNETRGFHLNNLSYAGPIVMGVGGFIVVAACVMTFEARDSAAKVVPARLKAMAGNSGGCMSYHRQGLGHVGGSSRRSAASQTATGANSSGLGAISGQQAPGSIVTGTGTDWDQQSKTSPTDRRALTAALQQFSRELGATCGVKPLPKANSNHLSPILKTQLSRSPSAPLLCPGDSPTNVSVGTPSPSVTTSPRPSIHVTSRFPNPPLFNQNTSSGMRPGAYSLLSPAGLLKRHAVSVDESGPYNDFHKRSKESLHGSQSSMAMDLHLPNDCSVTLRVRDTARRRVLTRQRPIDAEDDHHASSSGLAAIPSSRGHHRRRSSNASDHVHHAHRRRREASNRPFLERAASTDARMMSHHPDFVCHAVNFDRHVATSQETVLHKHHHHHNSHQLHGHQHCQPYALGVASTSQAPPQTVCVHNAPQRRHSRGHRNSIELRKQRSYSPKGSREGTLIESVAGEMSSGNRKLKNALQIVMIKKNFVGIDGGQCLVDKQQRMKLLNPTLPSSTSCSFPTTNWANFPSQANPRSFSYA